MVHSGTGEVRVSLEYRANGGECWGHGQRASQGSSCLGFLRQEVTQGRVEANQHHVICGQLRPEAATEAVI